MQTEYRFDALYCWIDREGKKLILVILQLEIDLDCMIADDNEQTLKLMYRLNMSHKMALILGIARADANAIICLPP